MTAATEVARLRLARTEGVGPVTYRRLLARFHTPAAALAALPDLARAAGRQTPPSIPSAAEIAREIEGVARLGGRLLGLGDPDYPPLLALIDAAPAVIAVLGDPLILTRRAVAMVGARNASVNGMRLAAALASEMGLEGVVTVSGLARGIDTAAHEGALRTATTIACVAGGLDVAYPPENAALLARIAERGLVVAEAPLGTSPQARHFPRRNRIIAGLSLGVVVVEAALRSGSLITARHALEAGRTLFAVPGSPLDPRCRGSNDLIRSEGAVLTESAADIIGGLPEDALERLLAHAEDRAAGGMAETQAPFGTGDPDPAAVGLRLAELLGPEFTTVDDLVRRCQFSPSAVLGALEMLEIEGTIQRSGSQVCRLF